MRTHTITDSGNELSETKSDILSYRICIIIQKLDSLFQHNKETKRVYRGIDPSFIKVLQESCVLVNKSYTSATTNIETASSFGSILVFDIPNQMRIYDFRKTGSNDYEYEILIERNTQFIGYRSEKIGEHTVIYTTLTKWSLPEKKEVIQSDEYSKQLTTLDLDKLDEEDGIEWS